eukprot:12412719-Karenia_brevis.AAC.1
MLRPGLGPARGAFLGAAGTTSTVSNPLKLLDDDDVLGDRLRRRFFWVRRGGETELSGGSGTSSPRTATEPCVNIIYTCTNDGYANADADDGDRDGDDGDGSGGGDLY